MERVARFAGLEARLGVLLAGRILERKDGGNRRLCGFAPSRAGIQQVTPVVRQNHSKANLAQGK
jgi:hypothetical protein